LNQKEASEVVSVGNMLNRQNRKLWRKVEEDAFEGDPIHIMERSPKGNKRGDTELFFLYSEGEPIGRAATSIGEGWLSDDKKQEGVGFIDGFVIHPDHRHEAGGLIGHCVSVLKERGAEGVLVRSHGFPALAAHEFNDLAPHELASNPPWYIDVFEQKGFTKQKEWINFRLTLPREASHSELAKWEALVGAYGIAPRKLKWRNKQEIKQYRELAYELFVDHYGHVRSRPEDSPSFLKLLRDDIVNHIVKMRIYVFCNQDSDIVGFFSYHPDYNIFERRLAEYEKKKWYDLPAALKVIPDLIRALRAAKRTRMGSIGLRDDVKRSGLIRAMDYSLKVVLKEGYQQVDTGPVLVENAVVVKMLESFAKKYGAGVERMRYYTLQYNF
jgi:hypothetical protein